MASRNSPEIMVQAMYASRFLQDLHPTTQAMTSLWREGRGLKRNFSILSIVEGAKEAPTMPMLFWFPAILISETWSMAWEEVPALIPQPTRLLKE
jgi:hypothetical protein